jgi:hypothetical protein
MSGHLRLFFAAFLLSALPTSPASSNPFSFLFNAAPGEVTATAPAEEGCLPRPGKWTDGQHWVYRFDGHRKCWQVAAGVAAVKKPAHHHVVKQRVAAPEENEAALRKQDKIVEAGAELLGSARAEMFQPMPPAPELKMVDAAPVASMGAAGLVPPAPLVAKPATDQLTPDYSTPQQVDVEALLAAAPSASNMVASSVAPANPVTVPIAEASDHGRGGPASRLGMLLIALGLVSLLTSTWSFWRPVLVGRFLDQADDGRQRHKPSRSVPMPPWRKRELVRAAAAEGNATRSLVKAIMALPKWVGC